MKLFLICLIAMSCIIVSCNNNTDTTEKQIKTHKVEINQMLISVPDDVTEDNITGYIAVGNARSLIDNEEKNSLSVLASFYKENYTWAVDAGTLTMNGNTVKRHRDYTNGSTPDSTTSYSLYPEVLNMNSTQYSFTASGSGYYPSFTISCLSPQSPVDLTAPAANQSVSKSSNLNVTWNCVHDTTHIVRIAITDVTGLTSIFTYPNDTGSFTIPSTDLSSLAVGQATIQIICGRYALQSIPGNEYALLVVLSSDAYKINITN